MHKKQMRALFYAWTPTFLWMLVILVLTVCPAKTLPKIGAHGMDKLVHFLEFFVLGPLMVQAFLKSHLNMRLGAIAILTIVLASLYAGTGEWLQNFVPDRAPDIFDLLSDLLGLNVGVFMYLRGEKDWHK